jgi:hypothetical protein
VKSILLFWCLPTGLGLYDLTRVQASYVILVLERQMGRITNLRSVKFST